MIVSCGSAIWLACLGEDGKSGRFWDSIWPSFATPVSHQWKQFKQGLSRAGEAPLKLWSCCAQPWLAHVQNPASWLLTHLGAPNRHWKWYWSLLRILRSFYWPPKDCDIKLRTFRINQPTSLQGHLRSILGTMFAPESSITLWTPHFFWVFRVDAWHSTWKVSNPAWDPAAWLSFFFCPRRISSRWCAKLHSLTKIGPWGTPWHRLRIDSGSNQKSSENQFFPFQLPSFWVRAIGPKFAAPYDFVTCQAVVEVFVAPCAHGNTRGKLTPRNISQDQNLISLKNLKRPRLSKTPSLVCRYLSSWNPHTSWSCSSPRRIWWSNRQTQPEKKYAAGSLQSLTRSIWKSRFPPTSPQIPF